jgi:integrase
MAPSQILGRPKLARDRVLADDELRAVWNAAERIGYPYGPLIHVLILTGARRGEIAEGRWSEIDLPARLWRFPAERMKSKAAHVLPLTPDVTRILEGLPRFGGGEFIFSTTFGRVPISGFAKWKTRLDALAVEELRRPIAPFVVHDIRRTMRTGLSSLPIPDLVRELVIAHARPGLHKVYDQHAYLHEKREALELWQARVREIVDRTTQR